jgi:Peptidase C13 family
MIARTGHWIREGLRAGVFLAPRVAGTSPLPRQLLAIVGVAIAVELLLGRLEVPGAASFNVRLWLASWWTVAASVLLVWALLHGVRESADPSRPAGIASWFALWFMAAIPPSLFAQALTMLHARDALPPQLADSAAFGWGSWILLWVWTLGIAVRMGWHFGMDRARLASLGAGLFILYGLSAWQFPDRPWEAVAPVAQEAPAITLSQESFEAQQAAWRKALDGLAAERKDVVDVYGLVFAPYAPEDVFLRESTLVAELLVQRFDAKGRVLQLVNHASTMASQPWATPLNLRRAIEELALRMNRDQDVLVVYLTSHGASDFQLAAAHPPLQVDTLSPTELRRALDEAGIKHRVIVVSACYSGGWIGPLASDTTLVMTAADAQNTSYGCGKLSELTFFGRAVFGEQLRKTRSFEQAFAAAVPVIKQREEEAGKADGFSNPQISVGAGIRPVLKALEQRLDGARP